MNIENFYSQYFKPGVVSTDSRNIKPGDIFIALKGKHFNGELFAESALKQGAKVAVVEKSISPESDRIIKVENTLRFLQELAHYHRIHKNLKIIGLTGTNGKTTTKELIRIVLAQKYRVQSTTGNLNNHIGVPLTLLSVADNTEITVVEMGANHQGEIRELCEIVRPQSGLITNIGKAHLEGFGNFEGVRKTKAELYDFLKKQKGRIYFNGSDEILTDLIDGYENKIAYNSTGGICSGKVIATLPTLTLEIIDSNSNKQLIGTNLYGNYNLENVLAAVAVGLDHGLGLAEIKKGIEDYFPDNLRSQFISFGSTQLIIDCYNANPTSMEQALISFSLHKSLKKIAILGGMKELGSHEHEEHERLGDLIPQLNFNGVVLYGKEFENIKIANSVYFDLFAELENYIRQIDLRDTAFLIKGSRTNKLERIVDIIKTTYSSNN
jgi:UDP-N-acetylmuramoyl-tripeptide--D-alanyl-D-alanine ligase